MCRQQHARNGRLCGLSLASKMNTKHQSKLLIILSLVVIAAHILAAHLLRPPSDTEVVRILLGSPWRLQSASWGDRWMGNATNQWIQFFSNQLCLYHAPFPINWFGTNALTYRELQQLGHQYSGGYDDPIRADQRDLIGMPPSTSRYVRWSYASPQTLPPMDDAIERAYAIVRLTFYESNQITCSAMYRVRGGLQHPVYLQHHCDAKDGIADLDYFPSSSQKEHTSLFSKILNNILETTKQ